MKTNAVFVQQATVSTPKASTTVTYTTTTCACTVNGQPTAVKVIVDSGDTEKTSVGIPTPTFSLSACYGAAFIGFKITVLPTLGVLKLNGAAVTVNQIISKADFSKLIYTVTANTAGTDTISYILQADCGASSTIAITLNLIQEDPSVDEA